FFPATERVREASIRTGRSRSIHVLAFFRTLAISLFIAALAGPRFGSETRETTSEGIDIMLAVDISGSMLALDLDWKGSRATRLEVVKDVVGDFIAKRPGDRIGLVAFGSEPYLASPLTLEHDWLKNNLARIEVGIVEPGTSIGPPVGMAIRRLEQDRDAKSRIIVLLTDGNDSVPPAMPPEKYAEVASALGIRIYTIGVGKGGVVPTYYLDRQGDIVRNMFGKPDIITQDYPLDETVLKSIAAKAGGKYFRARSVDDLKEIYADIDRLEKTKVNLSYRTEYEEKWQWPLLAGLALLMLEQLLAWTRLRTLP
ncbi:MAG TPA: VWA domain-containing protein, partial [Opitutales bacterium]|nr:VWA domain-containing protein [Opitutales bacterium]